MTVLHIHTIRKLMKKAGAERVSNNAVQKFTEILEEAAMELVADAVQLARNAGRKTVRTEDIMFLRRAKLFREIIREAKEEAEDMAAE